jgi:chemotaxis signal transduction protein
MLPTAAAASDAARVAALPAEDFQALLFKLGTRTFAVPLADVRYVSPMPADFAASGENTADHFVFEGSPLSYVSLWDRLHLGSEYAEYSEMQAMLPQRRQDHLDWMAALEDSIRSGTPFAKARDPHQCAFGKWYYAHSSQDRRLNLLLGQFDHPHATIHALADRLLALAESGRGAEALQAFEEARNTTLATLMRLFDTAQELVVELQRRIAVIVTAGDDTCALGADGVRDIVDVPADGLKPNTGTLGRTGTAATTGLIVLDDRNVIPLLNWRLFCAGA